MKAKVDIFKINESMKPIHKNTIKSIEKNSARFIYVSRDGIAKCERCETTFATNAKHLATEKCPKCHKTMTVIHSWRRSSNRSIHWECTGQAITESLFAIRYYLVIREDGRIEESAERARLFIDFDRKKDYKFENSTWSDGWKKSGRNFFREFGMSYARNSLFCMDAPIRKKFFAEVKKISAIAKVDLESLWGKNYYATAICPISKKADLYEKLQKVGLNALVKADLNTYSQYEEIKVNKGETSLVGMLGINKQSLRLLKTMPTLLALKALQSNPNMSEKDFAISGRFTAYTFAEITKTAKEIFTTPHKLISYMDKQGCAYTEISRHTGLLERLGYDLHDIHYTMPKDFAKSMDRLEKEKAEKEKYIQSHKDELIKAVSDKLRANKALREFFNGTSEFIVVCPQSAEDFKAEGKAQHNCVGGYVERQAKEETLVLFVRERNNPKASFVTMEYKNGQIVQCMLNHNKPVEKTAKVYNFCDRLACRLREQNILVA